MANLFAKVGSTYNRTEKSGAAGAPTGKEDGFGLSYGLGIGFNLTQQVQIVGEWERHRLDFVDRRDDVDMLSVGLRYRF
jgi:opacity protein-like surface antigen